MARNLREHPGKALRAQQAGESRTLPRLRPLRWRSTRGAAPVREHRSIRENLVRLVECQQGCLNLLTRSPAADGGNAPPFTELEESARPAVRVSSPWCEAGPIQPRRSRLESRSFSTLRRRVGLRQSEHAAILRRQAIVPRPAHLGSRTCGGPRVSLPRDRRPVPARAHRAARVRRVLKPLRIELRPR